MTIDETTIDWLGSTEAIAALESCVDQFPLGPKSVEKLRVVYGAQRSGALLQAAAAMGKAKEKWGPGLWLVTERAIQQATDRAIARYKASQVPADQNIVDCCCGAGGESMALADRGPLIGVDSDPVVAAMARHNLRIAAPRNRWQIVCEDVCNFDLPGDAWLNIDPDRRPQQNRTTRVDCFQPPIEQWMPMATKAIGASIKLAPATSIPDQWLDVEMGTREWISSGGSCRQQVWWLGAGSSPCRWKATKVRAGDRSAVSYQTDRLQSCAVAEQPAEFVYDLDPAVRAAGLSESYAADNGLASIGGATGFFTASHALDCALVQRFTVRWFGNADMKKIRIAAKSLDANIDVVKVRGVDWHPQRVRTRLRDCGNQPMTLLVNRVHGRALAILASAESPSQSPSQAQSQSQSLSQSQSQSFPTLP